MKKKSTSIIESLIICPLSLFLEFSIQSCDSLPVYGAALLVGKDHGEEGAELDLGVGLHRVQLPDALLQLTLQHQGHAVEEFKCGISTEINIYMIAAADVTHPPKLPKSLHPLDCSILHGMELFFPAVIVNLGLDQCIRVCHRGYL